MNDLNRVLLMGRIGKDPELRTTQTGKTVGHFSLCTNRGIRTADGVWDDVPEWHKVVVWQKHAENASRILGKGDKVFVEGDLRYNKWTDNSGQKRTSSEVVAQRWELVQKKYRPETAEQKPAENDPTPVPF